VSTGTELSHFEISSSKSSRTLRISRSDFIFSGTRSQTDSLSLITKGQRQAGGEEDGDVEDRGAGPGEFLAAERAGEQGEDGQKGEIREADRSKGQQQRNRAPVRAAYRQPEGADHGNAKVAGDAMRLERGQDLRSVKSHWWSVKPG
jgi:hypothetical protein